MTRKFQTKPTWGRGYWKSVRVDSCSADPSQYFTSFNYVGSVKKAAKHSRNCAFNCKLIMHHVYYIDPLWSWQHSVHFISLVQSSPTRVHVVLQFASLIYISLADPTRFAVSSNEALNCKVTACSVCASVVPCLCCLRLCTPCLCSPHSLTDRQADTHTHYTYGGSSFWAGPSQKYQEETVWLGLCRQTDRLHKVPLLYTLDIGIYV